MKAKFCVLAVSLKMSTNSILLATFVAFNFIFVFFLLLSILWILSFFIYSTIAFLSFFSLIRCGNIFCSDCLSFEMKLSIEAKPDPYGVTCKVCQTCFEDKRTGFFFLFLSYYFFSFFSFFSFSLFLFLSLFLSFSHSFSLSLFFLTPNQRKKRQKCNCRVNKERQNPQNRKKKKKKRKKKKEKTTKKIKDKR